MLSRLAALATHRPRPVILFAILVSALGLGVGLPGLRSLSTKGFDVPGSESVRAFDRISAATGTDPAPGLLVLVRPPVSAGPKAVLAKAESARKFLAGDPDVARIDGPFGPAAAAFISRDGRSAYLAVTLRKDGGVSRVQDAFAADPTLVLGGAKMGNQQANDTIREDLLRAEAIAFPLLFLLSLWVFRGLVAALLPPLIGAVVILGAFLGLALLNRVLEVSVYASNLVTGLSLGLAIDYSLLVISRYREELARGAADPVQRTLQTAGKSVVFSALTVAGAMAGLCVFPQRFLVSMGFGGVMVAVIAGGAALTLLPAILGLLGGRINALSPPRWKRASERAHERRTSGGWYRLSRWVMRRPREIAAVTATALIVAGLPVLGIRFTSVDARSLPSDASARIVSETLRRDFALDTAAPVLLATTAPANAASALMKDADMLRRLPSVRGVVGPEYVGRSTWRTTVIEASDPLSDDSQTLVHRIRTTNLLPGTLVGGFTAGFIDQKAAIQDRLVLAIVIVAFVTFLALFLMTGSLILPIKAILMNALTLCATLGILVRIFQDGRLEGLLAYSSQGAIDLTQPILLAVLAFGLSTDYAVFLLSRIKEERDAGHDNRESVSLGLERTGRVVTAAALLFCVAVGAFATSRIVILKELGLGTALAVLIDATIVRALLVPSLMAMLGRWNWWAPAPLRRLHGRIGLSESSP